MKKQDVLNRLHEDYNAWTDILTSRSRELSFGIIAANWAINPTGLSLNLWARASMLFAVSTLIISVIYSGVIAYSLRKRHDEVDHTKDENFKPDGYGCYDEKIDYYSVVYQYLKFFLPLIAGVCFAVSILH